MDETKLHCNARVTITVEVTVRQGWPSTSPIGSASAQAAKEAEADLRRVLASEPACRVVGKPRVELVTFEVVDK